MDQYNWLVAEILMQQRQRELAAQRPAAPELRHGEGLRHALANAMVRLGLRLDSSAGERLALTRAPEGR